MNALVEDISKKHQMCVNGSLKLFLKAKEFEEIKYKDTTQMYQQFTDALENNIKYNFPDALNVIKQSKRMNKKSDNHFFNLPDHLIHAYYMLRHLKIRDHKVKIQYALNYYRSIQRQLAFDLHEMSTRDTVLGDQEFKPPAGATRISTKNLANNSSAGAAGNSKKQQLEKARSVLQDEDRLNDKVETNEYDYVQNLYEKARNNSSLKDLGEDISEVENPVDKNKYRYKQKLKNRFISSCPIMSSYHTSFGYTTHRISEAEQREFEADYDSRMDLTSKKFMGRTDSVEFTDQEEILIKDDFGIHIMYDCVETDMEMLKDEILLTGSFFIKNQEPLMDAEDTEKLTPIIDRISTLETLLEYEAKFHYKKAQIVKLYMEAYEHIVDPLEQKRFIQLIVNMMAERPRLNLDSSSFKDSYELEIHILDKKLELLRNIVQFQISNEKKVNEDICDYLEKAHTIINDGIDGKWKYVRPQNVNQELKERGIEKIDTTKSNPASTKKIEETKEPIEDPKEETKFSNIKRQNSPSKKQLQDLYKKNRRGLIGLEEEPEDRFSKALGLPKIGQEDIYKKYRENDQEALDIMNEQANFIQNEEANPRRFNTSDYLMDTQISGEKTGVLDFYESLSNIHWVQPMLDECMKELIDVHKPFNNYHLAALEIVLLDKTISLFTDIRDQENNNVYEYEGKAYIEDESLI